ncbi:unnamed protein product [Ostreobium quekettii]|uniref:Uncharacterized protein n=1 Tax=Ostreobium quekettii TaxID=121088 RepID=A0A8S1J6N1_9CHLO|nr:unnamed protein product [Ostreobium quekettii]
MRGPPPGEPQEPWRVPAIKAHPAGASVRGATPHLRVYFVMATCADPASAATLDTLARRGSISEARQGGSCIRLKGVNGPRLDGGPSKLTPLPPPSLAGPAAHGRQPNRLAQISLKRGRMATRLSAVFVLVCALAVASRACQIHDRSGRSLLAVGLG